jgi:hypothetical protein
MVSYVEENHQNATSIAMAITWRFNPPKLRLKKQNSDVERYIIAIYSYKVGVSIHPTILSSYCLVECHDFSE